MDLKKVLQGVNAEAFHLGVMSTLDKTIHLILMTSYIYLNICLTYSTPKVSVYPPGKAVYPTCWYWILCLQQTAAGTWKPNWSPYHARSEEKNTQKVFKKRSEEQSSRISNILCSLVCLLNCSISKIKILVNLMKSLSALMSTYILFCPFTIYAWKMDLKSLQMIFCNLLVFLWNDWYSTKFQSWWHRKKKVKESSPSPVWKERVSSSPWLWIAWTSCWMGVWAQWWCWDWGTVWVR